MYAFHFIILKVNSNPKTMSLSQSVEYSTVAAFKCLGIQPSYGSLCCRLLRCCCQVLMACDDLDIRRGSCK